MIIYKCTNIINNKCYIGQTINSLQERINGHRYQTRQDKRYAFHNALIKYGENNFEWEILCECTSKNELNDMEFHYIKQYHSHGTEYGYNMTWGGDTPPIMYGDDNPSKRSDIRKKLSEGKIGKMNPFYGKKHTQKSLLRMSKASQGKNNTLYGKSDIRTKSDKNRLKRYHFISPDNIEMTIIDMVRFCEENKLNRHNMYSTASYKQSNHKGWKSI